MKKPPTLRLTEVQKKVAAELGRIGGQTRAKNLTADKRRRIAIKASKAAAKARTQKANKQKSKLRKGTFTNST
ncbi:MAG TPA: hypothetical protein VN950_19215 [Terriglobales bacterium]|nr:hypothetical protein [Terriglobales bacterium]